MQWSEVKDETPFRYSHADIRIQVVVIYGPTRYQLDREGSLNLGERKSYTNIV